MESYNIRYFIKKGQIQNAPKKYKVDAIVNAASPMLAGGKEGSVDWAIHKKLDKLTKQKDFLKNRIEKKLKISDKNSVKLYCKRGQAVSLSGHPLCHKIIFTVGPKSDASIEKGNRICSSSRIEILEQCYRNVILKAVKDKKIKKIAFPVIASGNYGVSFETAFKIGLVSIHNTLIDLMNQDSEWFSHINLREIYFVIPDRMDIHKAEKIYNRYEPVLKRQNRMVYSTATDSLKSLYCEVKNYDNKNGFFSITQWFRLFLLFLRLYIFPISNIIKDKLGGIDWKRRRYIMELLTFVKLLLPIVSLVLCNMISQKGKIIISLILFYDLLDTITYLISLIVFADIQRPSANIIRSMITLLINYLQVILEWAVIMNNNYSFKMDILKVVGFCFAGISIQEPKNGLDYFLYIGNYGINFFFMTLAFGYFVAHLRQRSFRNSEIRRY